MTFVPHHFHHVDEVVHLKVDIPDLGLHCGEAGLVCSIWSFDSDAYEVEFREPNQKYPIRALVSDEQLEPDEQPSPQSDPIGGQEWV